MKKKCTRCGTKFKGDGEYCLRCQSIINMGIGSSGIMPFDRSYISHVTGSDLRIIQEYLKPPESQIPDEAKKAVVKLFIKKREVSSKRIREELDEIEDITIVGVETDLLREGVLERVNYEPPFIFKLGSKGKEILEKIKEKDINE